MENILKTLNEAFSKSAGDELKFFLARYPECSSYIIASDYCLNDKERPNDIISFVLLPEIRLFDEYRKEIKEAMPKDIQELETHPVILIDMKKLVYVYSNGDEVVHSKYISDKAKELLASPNYHSFNFFIDKEKTLFDKKKFNQEAIFYAADKAIEMFDLWLQDDPDNERYKQFKKNYKLLKEAAKSKSFNYRLYFYSLLTSTIAAFLTHQISIHSKAKNVLWFSDRDSMMNSNNQIFFDNYDIQHNGLARNDSAHAFDESFRIGIAKPDPQGDVWYDEINRLPDYCAGAVSGLNFLEETNYSDKANEVLQVMIENSTNLIMSRETINGETITSIITRKIVCEKIEE